MVDTITNLSCGSTNFIVTSGRVRLRSTRRRTLQVRYSVNPDRLGGCTSTLFRMLSSLLPFHWRSTTTLFFSVTLSTCATLSGFVHVSNRVHVWGGLQYRWMARARLIPCLLYTSDAADE